ncbi:hypothetical protein SS50377_22886 [Spironucleus salmonicida]|uniref:Coatomer subunit zeta n=1 Tax=Spironucleus salmonicida TaxID=348837 RepID=V6LVT4_9EUKA|nr:hypothetical protein SS50377_22883 [Spironucleus salmonicida]KAH0575259.1 hypothetical protein SS50377_22886 [Spironucleus salmonicida]|eukprot:EST48737.1 Hypothetical protein SS50377_11055 [Spironucleus salmonicida]
MIEAVRLTSARTVLYARQYTPGFSLSQLPEVVAGPATEVHYHASLVCTRRLGELSLFLYAAPDANELYLEHCLDCVASAVRSVLSELTEAAALESLLTLTAALSETVDAGYLLTNRAVELFDQEKGGSGLVGGLLNGAKLVAKTLLS